MTNYEWLMKNWDKKVNDNLFFNTVGLVFARNGACEFIRQCSDADYNCAKCYVKWFNSEATKDNNIYFDLIKD